MPDLGAFGNKKRDEGQPPSLVRAEVLETPADATSVLRLVAPSFSNEREYRVLPGRWGGEPAVGDQVLLAFDELGNEWLVAAWPQ